MITTTIQIRFSDIDMLGHVNNIILQQYYDLGKVDYFKDVLSMPPIWREVAFVAVSTATNYFEEVRIEDHVNVITKVTKLGTKSVTFTQEIVDYTTNTIKSRSESVLVAFDLKLRTSIDIKSSWRDKILDHDSGVITN
ncbi:MAG: thioesterase family protein [Rikenellaceae bacterium]